MSALIGRSAGAVLIAVAFAALVFRLPGAVRHLDNLFAAQQGREQAGGSLATADLLGIDDGFVVAALRLLPRDSQFTTLVPDPAQAHAAYGVSVTTIEAVPGFMLEVLLPRRAIDPAKPGTYVLCYLCDRSAWDSRTRWLWKGTRGDSIGLVRR